MVWCRRREGGVAKESVANTGERGQTDRPRRAVGRQPSGMADTQMLVGEGGDLFDGLGIDYAFLGDATTGGAGAMASDASGGGEFMAALTGSSSASAQAAPADDDQKLFETELGEGDKQDMLAPLAFSFNGNGQVGGGGVRYHAAPQHKHKRVRSNPDVLQSFNVSPLAMAPGSGGMLADGTPLPIGPVQVSTPVGLAGDKESFQEMDEFLQELQWSDLATDGAQAQAAAADATQAPLVHVGATGENMVAYRAQRIQEGVNEIKMKRKRPGGGHHSRHYSNPVDLLHNLDQFRVLAQQSKQQPLGGGAGGVPSSQFVNPFGGFHDPTALQQVPVAVPPQPQPQFANGMVPPVAAGQANPYQFQVPPEIASGAARSLHARRSSMGSNMPPRSRRGVRSTGLSMDMSQMNLSFLSVPEEELQPAQAQPSSTRSGGGMKKSPSSVAAETDAQRKLYKCGRCGQPKVGHVCTMPDQRNNWSQVDLEVTKGLKVMRINCHILPVKSKWIPQHEDHVAPGLP